MLDKRTNLLMKEEDFRVLDILSKEKGVSIGQLIRRAIKNYYQEQFKKFKKDLKDQKKLAERIMEVRDEVQIDGEVDYKSLVEKGRKY